MIIGLGLDSSYLLYIENERYIQDMLSLGGYIDIHRVNGKFIFYSLIL